ncbi:MAG: DUF6057 family protein [Prevotella sp.]|jgi:hypothetical protein
MTNQLKRGTAFLRALCAVLFLFFSFFYLYDYQADILSVTQHVLSKGVTHYDRTIGAVVITLVLGLLQLVIYAVTRLNGYFHALTFFPSFLLLGILTDVSPQLEQESYIGHWYWIFPLLMIIFFGVTWMCRQIESMRLQSKSVGVVSLIWVNLLFMVAMMLMTCLIGCSDHLFHHRMRVENLLLSGKYDEATRIGLSEEETDSSLTFLRIYALSKTHQLGERLFEYPLMGKSDAMLPNNESVKLMMVPETDVYKELGVFFNKKMHPTDYFNHLHSTKWATRASHDWLLCAYLLDGNIDAFANALPKYYQIDSLLPKHYKEALTLYVHQTPQPSIVYKSPVLEADYEDFTSLRRRYKDVRLRNNKLRDSYGKTYWYYYYCE